jgi:hypothetical protein
VRRCPVKVSGWIYYKDCGDGSVVAEFFPTREQAEEIAKKDMEYSGQRLCEDVETFEFEVEDGQVVPTTTPTEWDEVYGDDD